MTDTKYILNFTGSGEVRYNKAVSYLLVVQDDSSDYLRAYHAVMLHDIFGVYNLPELC